jgi:hypothetical protein
MFFCRVGITEVMKKAGDGAKNKVDGAGERPECFGDMSKVCPRDEEGIRQPRVECLPCGSLKTCLQHGLIEEGVAIPKSAIESPAVTKVSGFLKRWSDRKLAGGSS